MFFLSASVFTQLWTSSSTESGNINTIKNIVYTPAQAIRMPFQCETVPQRWVKSENQQHLFESFIGGLLRARVTESTLALKEISCFAAGF